MIRKMLCILICIFFMINLSSIESANDTPESNFAPPPQQPLFNLTITYINGDWDVYNVTTVSNKIIDLRGNLTIHDGGFLTFKSVILFGCLRLPFKTTHETL